jgi:hypothetical protein
VVDVNNKPQYLVFCLHSRNIVPKYGGFACGKLKMPSPAAYFGPKTCT